MTTVTAHKSCGKSHGKKRLKRKGLDASSENKHRGCGLFQVRAAATGKARLPSVDSRVRRTFGDSEEADRRRLRVSVILAVSYYWRRCSGSLRIPQQSDGLRDWECPVYITAGCCLRSFRKIATMEMKGRSWRPEGPSAGVGFLNSGSEPPYLVGDLKSAVSSPSGVRPGQNCTCCVELDAKNPGSMNY